MESHCRRMTNNRAYCVVYGFSRINRFINTLPAQWVGLLNVEYWIKLRVPGQTTKCTLDKQVKVTGLYCLRDNNGLDKGYGLSGDVECWENSRFHWKHDSTSIPPVIVALGQSIAETHLALQKLPWPNLQLAKPPKGHTESGWRQTADQNKCLQSQAFNSHGVGSIFGALIQLNVGQ